jgi:glycine/serine hydroxymethyltransferase
MKRIADMIDRVLQDSESEQVVQTVRAEVRELASAFPLYPAPAIAPQ